MPKRFLPARCLILLMGVAGSGKTTLSREILRHLAVVYLDNNQIAGEFFPDTRIGSKYTFLRPQFYRALYTIAEENLRFGNAVLLDVPHIKEAQETKWYRSMEKLAARARAKVVAIRCRCSEDVLRFRLESRGEKRDGWKLSHWKELLQEQPVDLPLWFPHLDLDTEANLARNTRKAIRYILERARTKSKQTGLGKVRLSRKFGAA